MLTTGQDEGFLRLGLCLSLCGFLASLKGKLLLLASWNDFSSVHSLSFLSLPRSK